VDDDRGFLVSQLVLNLRLTFVNSLFVSQLADGIIGMSMYDTTLAKQLYNKGRLEHNIFALCYRRELGSSKRGVSAGSMTLGGVSNSLDTSKIIYAKNMATVGFYTVYVKGIYIRSGGGQSARTPSQGDYQIHKVPLNVHKVNSGKGVIVDSGTTDTYLNKNMARSFNKMWKMVTGSDYANTAISLNDEQLRSLPTILVQCQVSGRAFFTSYIQG
jgi:Eukaryotic aspartyl protease